MIRFSFEFKRQDGRHLENICRFDLCQIIVGASLILTGILFKWINDSNYDDNDITSSSSNVNITITTPKVWNY